MMIVKSLIAIIILSQINVTKSLELSLIQSSILCIERLLNESAKKKKLEQERIAIEKEKKDPIFKIKNCRNKIKDVLSKHDLYEVLQDEILSYITSQYVCIRNFINYSFGTNSLCVLDDCRLITDSNDYYIKIWDVNTGEYVQLVESATDWVSSLCSLPNGFFAAGLCNGLIKIWDVNSRSCVKSLIGHTNWVKALCVLQYGNLLASGSYDKKIKIWDLNTGNCLQTLEGHRDWINHLAILPNGDLVSGSYDNTIKIWDLNTGNCLKTIESSSGPFCVLPNGNLVLAISKQIKILDINNSICLKTLTGHFNWIRSVYLLPNGNLASSSADQTVKIWDINTGECLQTLGEHNDCVTSLCVFPNGNLVSWSCDGNIKIWARSFDIQCPDL